MKKGWLKTRLSEISLVQSGSGFPDKYQGQADQEIPFYKVSDMNSVGNERAMFYANNTISEDVRKVLGASIFPKGSIIFPKIGGAIATNKKRMTTQNCCVDNNVMGVIPKKEKIDGEFLFYFFLAHDLSEFANEAHLPSIRKTVVENWEITLPDSLPEQQRIVRILDEAFEGIATAKANAEKNLQNARALFESHLQAVFSQRGEGWEERRLSDVAENISTGPFGTMLHKSDYVPDGIPLVNPMNIVDSHIVPSNKMMVNKKTRERLNGYVLKAGDIVIARRGELGRCALVTEREEGWLCGTGSFFVRLSDCMDGKFFVALFGSPQFRTLLEGNAVGTTMSSLNHGILNDLPILVPPIEMQRAIMAKADELLSETQHLASIYQRKLAALEALKKSLLYQAFNGEL